MEKWIIYTDRMSIQASVMVITRPIDATEAIQK